VLLMTFYKLNTSDGRRFYACTLLLTTVTKADHAIIALIMIAVTDRQVMQPNRFTSLSACSMIHVVGDQRRPIIDLDASLRAAN